MNRFLVVSLLLFAGTLAAAPKEAQNKTRSDAASPKDSPGDAAIHRKSATGFFGEPILRLNIEISDKDLQELRDDPRHYIEGEVRDGTKTYKGVAIKLKGASGSFKPIDEKPCFTLNFDKFKGAERFHGLKKCHLNNANEDPSFLHQLLCGEMTRAAGVPALRCTHAFVELNGRDLGLYVFTEGYSKDFFAQFFSDPGGDVYESGFIKDLDQDLHKDAGPPKDFRAIEELIAASRIEDKTERWTRLRAILDVDRFASFLAVEALLGIQDGYDFGHNNYRIYHDPVTKLLSFIPHGMDEPFGDPGFPIQKHPESIVGSAFVGCPEGHRLYRERVIAIYEKVFAARDWPARVTEASKKVCAAVSKVDAGFARELADRHVGVRNTVRDRIKNIAQQIDELGTPFEFDKSGIARLDRGWRTEGDNGDHDEVKLDGKACFHLRADGETNASWRKQLSLEAGRYRFEARVRAQGVEATRGDSGEGVGVRISGASRIDKNAIAGNAPWGSVAYEFETDGGDVVLVAELRATKGEAWFEKGSMRLVMVK